MSIEELVQSIKYLRQNLKSIEAEITTHQSRLNFLTTERRVNNSDLSKVLDTLWHKIPDCPALIDAGDFYLVKLLVSVSDHDGDYDREVMEIVPKGPGNE